MLLFLSKATLLFHHTVTMIFLANNQLKKTRASTMLEIFKITIKLKSFIKNNCR